MGTEYDYDKVFEVANLLRIETCSEEIKIYHVSRAYEKLGIGDVYPRHLMAVLDKKRG